MFKNVQSTILNKSKTNFLKKEAIPVAVIFAKDFCRVDLKLSQISQASVMLVDVHVVDKHSGAGLVVSELGLSGGFGPESAFVTSC